MRQLVPILLYHSISEGATSRFRQWTVSPRQFAEQLAYLQASRYTALTVTQLAQALWCDGRLPPKPVLITFDDGFADFYTDAFPILKKYHYTATLYVVTKFIGGRSRWLASVGEAERRMLTWDQLRAIHANGIECGAHGETHPQLDILPEDEARREIEQSKAELEERLGQRVTSFAYPYGYHSAKTIELVEKAGFAAACAVKHAMSRVGDDPFALARMFVFGNTGVKHFAALLEGRATPITWRGERFSTKGWRVVRRLVHLLKRGKRGGLT
jgi:peptidoglycan/xylan/chitin deacetylase (PgdA/CDA1 family)